MNTVPQILLHRARTHSTPNARTDGIKLALVIEGGGMRGVVSAGMVAALETLRLTQCFDAVYGSSAGAINGAYFLAGQARYGTTIYYQDIANLSFINVFRIFRGRPIVSLSFLLDYVAESVKPLKWDEVLSSSIPLKVIASSISNGNSVVFHDFANKNDLKECLRGSASIPMLAGLPTIHRAQRLWDALVFQDIPIHAAVADGCTHVMALLTNPIDDAEFDLNWLDRHLMAEFIGLQSRFARHSYLEGTHSYAKVISRLASGNFTSNGREIHSLAVQVPAGTPRIHGMETSSHKLRDAARAGFAAVYKSLSLPQPQIVEILSAFEKRN